MCLGKRRMWNRVMVRILQIPILQMQILQMPILQMSKPLEMHK